MANPVSMGAEMSLERHYRRWGSRNLLEIAVKIVNSETFRLGLPLASSYFKRPAH
jgi:hypothetical protein